MTETKFASRAPSMCPVMNTLIEQDWVAPTRKQRVAISQIRNALSHLGVGPMLKSLLVLGPMLANHREDLWRNLATLSFSLPHLHGGFFDHEASTETISQDRFDAEKFRVFERAAVIAKTPGRLGVDALAYVMVLNQLALITDGKPTSTKGFMLSLIELSALLNTFGAVDDEGRAWITLEDLRRIYASGAIDRPWQPHRITGLKLLGATMGKIGKRALEIADTYADALDALEVESVCVVGC